MYGHIKYQDRSNQPDALRGQALRRESDAEGVVCVASGTRNSDAGVRALIPAEGQDDRGPDNDSILKNVFDRLAALSALIVLSPLLLMVAALVYAREPGPVFFAHERIGKHGRRFRCLKFRTMMTNGDAILAQHLAGNSAAAAEWNETRKLQDDPRVSSLGNSLRRSSIDELPQLLNILAGEMSVVGPRPIVEAEAEYYGDAIHDYMSVRPGLTGLWQVSGRSDVGYGERVALDTAYVNNRTILGDLAIIMRTVKVVAFREGSY